MKQTSTKILIILIAIILIAGAIMIGVKGLAFDLKYQDNKKVEINISSEFKTSDIKEITNEVFGNQPVLIQAVEVYKDTVSITTTEITDEQKSDLVAKINEKYGKQISADEIKIEETSHIRGRDIIKPYIAPFLIATAIILVYMMIRYYKLNPFKVLIESVGIIILSELVLLGIMAITRMPIGRFTIPSVLLVYMIALFICTTKMEQKGQ